jgi:hypothetical protein
LTKNFNRTQHAPASLLLKIVVHGFTLFPMLQPEESVGFVDIFKKLERDPMALLQIIPGQKFKGLQEFDPFFRSDLDQDFNTDHASSMMKDQWMEVFFQ